MQGPIGSNVDRKIISDMVKLEFVNARNCAKKRKKWQNFTTRNKEKKLVVCKTVVSLLFHEVDYNHMSITA